MQMTALCRELKLNLDVAYLDGRLADTVDFVQFREGPESEKPLTLLYRCVLTTVGLPTGLNPMCIDLDTTIFWSKKRRDKATSRLRLKN